MTLLLNNLGGVANGTTLTQGSGGNTGGASGNFFDSVTVGTGTTLAADNTHAWHNSVSCKIASGATSASSWVQWDTSAGTLTTVWHRIYLFMTANPAANWKFLQPLNVSTQCGDFQINTSGKIDHVAGTGSTATNTGSVAIALNQWVRIETKFVASATVGQLEHKLFNTPDSMIADETLTDAATQNTNTAITKSRFGLAVATTNFGPIWMGNFGLSDQAYIGPIPNIMPTVILLRQHPVFRPRPRPTPAYITAAPPAAILIPPAGRTRTPSKHARHPVTLPRPSGGVSQPLLPVPSQRTRPQRTFRRQVEQPRPSGGVSQPIPVVPTNPAHPPRRMRRFVPTLFPSVHSAANPVAPPQRRRFNRSRTPASAAPATPTVVTPAVFAPPPAQIKPRRWPWRGRNGMWPPTPTVQAIAVPAVPGFAPRRHYRLPRKLQRTTTATAPGAISQPVPAPSSTPRRAVRWYRKPQRSAPALRSQPSTPAVTIPERTWRKTRRAGSAQFAPQIKPPPQFAPTAWWKKLQFWRRRPPASAPFPPPQVFGQTIPSDLESAAFVVNTLSSEPTVVVSSLLESDALVTGTLSCEVKKL